jgi:hypothetical protein
MGIQNLKGLPRWHVAEEKLDVPTLFLNILCVVSRGMLLSRHELEAMPSQGLAQPLSLKG